MNKKQTVAHEEIVPYLESLLKPSEEVQYSAGHWGIYDEGLVVHSTDSIDGLIIWAEERKSESLVEKDESVSNSSLYEH
jgi:hypothetical protein